MLLKPDLYTEPRANGDIFLRGGRCRCGYVFFPFQAYGCEQCGAVGEDLHAVELKGEGELVASALVHMHASELRTAPFIVASIRLNDGPVVRTLLDYPVDADPLKPGQALVASLVDVTDAKGEIAQDLRFTPR